MSTSRESEWFGPFLVGTHKNGPDMEIIKFVIDPETRRGSHVECLALDGEIVNSPEIRQAPLTWAPVMCDPSWAL